MTSNPKARSPPLHVTVCQASLIAGGVISVGRRPRRLVVMGRIIPAGGYTAQEAGITEPRGNSVRSRQYYPHDPLLISRACLYDNGFYESPVARRSTLRRVEFRQQVVNISWTLFLGKAWRWWGRLVQLPWHRSRASIRPREFNLRGVYLRFGRLGSRL